MSDDKKKGKRFTTDFGNDPEFIKHMEELMAQVAEDARNSFLHGHHPASGGPYTFRGKRGDDSMATDIGGIVIDYEVGDSYKKKSGAMGMRSPEAEERHEAREEAIKEFRAKAQETTRGQIAQATSAAVGLCIQLRALGGSFGDSNLASQLRELADFMEDL